MKKYLRVMKRKVDTDGHNETNRSLLKAKTRKYDKAYEAPSFPDNGKRRGDIF